MIFIFADDWGWGDLSVHGSEIYRTPNIDRLASQGTEFYQFSVNSPVCSPSRAAAMTGHFVLSTLHTIDAPKALDRLIDVFPPDQQGQIIAQLANSLQAVIAQRLHPRIDRAGRILSTEVLRMNHGVRACMRTRKFEQLVGLMEIGAGEGMHTFDDTLIDLYERGLIDQDEALAHCRDENRMLETKPKKGLFGKKR